MDDRKANVLKELEESFGKLKNELGFEASLEELNDAFSVKDSILGTGFVSTDLARQVCYRIADTFVGWHNYLNGLLMPNSNFMAGGMESKLFSDESAKKEVWELIRAAMEISSNNALLGLTDDKEEQAKFIDANLKYWKETFKPKIVEIMKKVNKGWQGKD